MNFSYNSNFSNYENYIMLSFIRVFILIEIILIV